MDSYPCRNRLMASMRPRRFRRGIAGSRRTATASRTGFNEAPAISPGNRPGASSTAVGPAAASMRPRRFRRGIVEEILAVVARGRASMRPRRFRRGIPARGGCGRRGSHRFNEAPAISPGNPAGGSPGPRRRSRRFNEAPAISPGNPDERRDRLGRAAAASMRPRRFRRGIPAGRCLTPSAGRRFNEAPAISPGNPAAHQCELVFQTLLQ